MEEGANVSVDFDKAVGSESDEKNNQVSSCIRKRYFIYDCSLYVRDFFLGERVTKTREDKLAEKAEQLLFETLNTDLLEQSRQLIEQQRELENTKARNRLERWATRTITYYLLIVLLLIFSNGVASYCFPRCAPNSSVTQGFISDTIMSVILTTTTINIIGLGVIILRGHFPNSQK